MKKAPAFATEADLCASFISWAEPQGWVAYPEWADFDILLVHNDGTQIGVQAKLKFNLQVLSQIAADSAWWPTKVGPDYLAILVPECTSTHLCVALGVTVFRHEHWGAGAFSPKLDLLKRLTRPLAT